MSSQKPTAADCPKGDVRADKQAKPLSPAHDNALDAVLQGSGKATLRTRAGDGDETHQSAFRQDASRGDADTLTTNQGHPISDNQNSLRAGERGPTLLEDFVLREKIFHFDHERIPERIVHARGSGAHGDLQGHRRRSPS